jgi:hypothetical protein
VYELRRLGVCFIVFLLVSGFTGIIFQRAAASSEPVFTAADVPITGSKLEAEVVNDETFSVSKTSGWLYFFVTYDYTGASAWIMLGISYYDDAAQATAQFQNTVDNDRDLPLTSAEVAKLSPSYDQIVQADVSSNRYKTILYIDQGKFDRGHRLYLPGGSGYEHYLVDIKVDGSGITSGDELKQAVDQVEGHATSLISQKVGASSSSPSQTTEQFEVQGKIGNVQVLIAGSSEWVPATLGMVLHPGDSVKTVGNPQDNIVKLFRSGQGISSSNKEVLIRGDSTVELKSYKSEHPEDPDADLIWDLFTHGGFVYYEGSSEPGVKIDTPHATITNKHTQFEVTVTDAGTTVNVIEGTVQVSDLNGTNTVNVDANQTATVPTGGIPQAPQALDTASLDRWWDKFITQQSSSTGFDLQGLMLYIIPVVAIVIVVVVVAVVFSRRRRLFPPPPPPP